MHIHLSIYPSWQNNNTSYHIIFSFTIQQKSEHALQCVGNRAMKMIHKKGKFKCFRIILYCASTSQQCLKKVMEWKEEQWRETVEVRKETSLFLFFKYAQAIPINYSLCSAFDIKQTNNIILPPFLLTYYTYYKYLKFVLCCVVKH